jgi:hypothetical protein
VNLRSYKKLQDIFGSVGGLYSILEILGILLVSPINKLDLSLKIINQIYTFEIDRK